MIFLRAYFFTFVVIFSATIFAQKTFQVRGTIFAPDSVAAVPFAYIINDCTHNGVISDINGRFVISAFENDSIHISYLGFQKLTFHVNKLTNENDSVKYSKKFFLARKEYDLGVVNINAFKIKPAERAYMLRIINRPKVLGVNTLESPLTALWQNFSKKGKELQKLEKIFEGLLRQEALDKKLNTDILRKLLNNESITITQFRIMCPEITDDYILYTNGYELYSSITNAYKFWKKNNKRSYKKNNG